MNYQEVISRAKLNDNNVVCVYPYGSRVYGNYHKNSDYDFIIILIKKTSEQFSDNLININFYTIQEHQQRLDDHEISAIECMFLINNSYKETMKFNFKLDKSKLRHSLSAKSSNSWVKCKKKLTIEKDYDLNIGRKSMFHSFRIIDFGIQIINYGKINDYSSCNQLYSEIILNYDWVTLFNIFKLRYNALLTEFRKLTTK